MKFKKNQGGKILLTKRVSKKIFERKAGLDREKGGGRLDPAKVV